MATAATNGIGNGFDYTNVNNGQVPAGSLPSVNKSGTNSSNSSATSAQAMQDNFLRLLTAQLNAQDPLNPMDNSQITSQMAQISQVAGLQTLNQTMQQLVSAQNATQSLMASSMINKNVLIAGNALPMPAAGQTVQGGVLLNGPASSVQVNVLDKNGNVVDSVPLKNPGKGMNTFSWDGKDASGNPLPADGAYTFQVQVTQIDKSGSTTATAYTTQQVKAVSWANGTPMLVLADNSQVPLANVAQMS
ncbi:flagellar hook capping protein [Chromobacterium phragmitis]|uniref:Basal-body rod modification protein FlgD n=1 Tax=Chromobacterium phragmitis TaxID=2202141 RepID=A0A344UE90_9NEIS|nr:flagellar hook capping FlgD N-terminal domain-containing protein [Chromobacterium phragmitis]AXE32200.1 flagellar hook capping protein [Chromobacterium phragmitis]AXE33588.1 flagellar hook capping protein [Chromobacterium phragmitis]